MQGAGRVPPSAGSGCTSSAGRLVFSYGTSTGSMRGLRMAGAASFNMFDRLCVDGLALLRALMNETLTGLVVARCAQEAGSCGPAVAPPLLFTSARLDLVDHADPFHEPSRVVPDMI